MRHLYINRNVIVPVRVNVEFKGRYLPAVKRCIGICSKKRIHDFKRSILHFNFILSKLYRHFFRPKMVRNVGRKVKIKVPDKSLSVDVGIRNEARDIEVSGNDA